MCVVIFSEDNTHTLVDIYFSCNVFFKHWMLSKLSAMFDFYTDFSNSRDVMMMTMIINRYYVFSPLLCDYYNDFILCNFYKLCELWFDFCDVSFSYVCFQHVSFLIRENKVKKCSSSRERDISRDLHTLTHFDSNWVCEVLSIWLKKMWWDWDSVLMYTRNEWFCYILLLVGLNVWWLCEQERAS